MRLAVNSDMKWSTAAFLTLVWPALEQRCGGGRIEPLELITATGASGLLTDFDLESGIDAWQVVSGAGIRGISSRVQVGDYRTFTIRYARPSGATTEWEKRRKALLGGRWIYPHLTIQGYVDQKPKPTRLNSAAVITTRSLYDALESYTRDNTFCPELVEPIEGVSLPRFNWAGNGGEKFIYVPWDWLRAKRVRIEIKSASEPSLPESTRVRGTTQGELKDSPVPGTATATSKRAKSGREFLQLSFSPSALYSPGLVRRR